MKRKLLVILGVVAVIVTVTCIGIFYVNNKVYYAEDFGIDTVKSSIDYNNNGVDDYSDIVLGARKDAENFPKYDGSYHKGGYPPDNVGVCTDVVWRAFKNAGYSLKDMVDADVERRMTDYTNIQTPDPNIDFRRVKNLRVFFEKYAVKLTLDLDKTSEWQAGDIVIFGDDKHIGIISDKRNYKGTPYVIHNGGQKKREEDCLEKLDFAGTYKVTGHYRFDASLVSESVLCVWRDDK